MNLLKAFPEIELFFQNESFSQEELLSFISELERQYSEKDIRKSASALIRLKLLQYDIAEKDNKQNIVARTKKIDFKSKRENKIHPMLSSLRKKSIEEIAYNIQWSTARLLRLIKQQGISKQRHNLLNDDEFRLVKEMFNNRLYILDRTYANQNPRVVKKYSEKFCSKQIGVYSKIQIFGPGKIIYIRKK